MIKYHPSDLSEGKFYVLRGVLVFLEKSEDELQEFVFESGSRMRFDGRTRAFLITGQSLICCSAHWIRRCKKMDSALAK